MSIADTLRDIADESLLNKAEKTSLRRIAKEYEKLQAEPDKTPLIQCWLIHPLDDKDCEQCPNVGECREVRKEINSLTVENAVIKKRAQAIQTENEKLRLTVLKMDHYCLTNEIDMEQFL